MESIRKYAVWSARLHEAVLGLVFLAGALLKAGDIDLFTVQISFYGVLSSPVWLAAAALGTLAVEAALGMALLSGLRLRGLTYGAVLGLLLVFTGLIVYGWMFHDLQDCGCFGPIELSPGVSIAKNGVLALLCAGAWWGYRHSEPFAGRRHGLAAQLAAAVLAAGVMPGYAWTQLEPVGETSRPFAHFDLVDDAGAPFDVSTGDYVVAMLSATCDHCLELMPRINELAGVPGIPPLVGLCYEEKPGTMAEFAQATAPAFPLLSIGDRIRSFFSLIGDAPPRFYLLRDGHVVKFWDDEVPEPEAIFEVQGDAQGSPVEVGEQAQ